MAFKILCSKPALDDLRGLTAFIAEDNPVAAERTGIRILKRVQLLTEHSLLGRMVPEVGRRDIRELVLRPYRIIYRVHARQRLVEIVRVWHAGRGEPEIFGLEE